MSERSIEGGWHRCPVTAAHRGGVIHDRCQAIQRTDGMRSPLITLLLVVLGWPVGILLGVGGYIQVRDWIAAEYPSAPAPEPPQSGPRFPAYRHIAVNAAAALRALPPPEQADVMDKLIANIFSPRQWLDGLERSKSGLICLGEQHDEKSRHFLARTVFPRLRLDTLMLETTEPKLEHMRAKTDTGRPYFPLLGADISGVLRAVAAKNPSARIEGIDETELQRKRRVATPPEGFRDDTLAGNFRARYRPGERTVLLFGAFHCLDESRLLFRQIRRAMPADGAAAMLSVRIIGEHEGGPVEAFAYFLDTLGVAPASFAIPHPRSLPPLVRGWFRMFTEETLDRYGNVVVVRPDT